MNDADAIDLTFVIPGPPQGRKQPKPTLLRRKGGALVVNKTTGAPIMHVHHDKKTGSYLAQVAEHARTALGETFVARGTAVRIDILAVVLRPLRLLRRKDPDSLIWCEAKPDWDNVAKAIADGCAAHWGDDCQIALGRAGTVYSERDRGPRVIVRIRTALPRPEEEFAELLAAEHMANVRLAEAARGPLRMFEGP